MTTRPTMTEAQLLDAVLDLARLRGWLAHHDRPARTSTGWRTAIQGDPGFPDLVLARGDVVLFIELKSAKGRLTVEQEAWRDALAGGAAWECWRPEDWHSGHIERVLR